MFFSFSFSETKAGEVRHKRTSELPQIRKLNLAHSGTELVQLRENMSATGSIARTMHSVISTSCVKQEIYHALPEMNERIEKRIAKSEKHTNITPRRQRKFRGKTLRMIVLSSACLLLCSIPITVTHVIEGMTGHTLPQSQMLFIKITAYAIFIMNPVIYCLLNTNYTQSVREILHLRRFI